MGEDIVCNLLIPGAMLLLKPADSLEDRKAREAE